MTPATLLTALLWSTPTIAPLPIEAIRTAEAAPNVAQDEAPEANERAQRAQGDQAEDNTQTRSDLAPKLQASDAEIEFDRALQTAREKLQGRDTRGALRYFETARELARDELNNPRQLGLVASAVGDLYADAQDSALAIDAYEEAIDAYTEAFDDEHPLVGNASSKLGRVLLGLGEYVAAEDRLDAALPGLRNGGDRAIQELAMALFFHVQAIDSQPDREHDALEAVESAIEELQDTLPAEARLWGYFYNARGYAYAALADRDPEGPARALEAHEASVDWHREYLGDDPMTADAIAGLARTYLDLRRYDDAAEAFEDAADRYRDVIDSEGNLQLSFALSGLSSARTLLMDHQGAIDAMREAAEVAAESDSPEFAARMTSGYSGVLKQYDFMQEAVTVMESALESADPDDPFTTILKAGLAEALGDRLFEGDEARADELFAQALDALQTTDESSLRENAWWMANQRAGFLIDRNRAEEAVTELNAMMDWARTLGSEGKPLRMDLLRTLSDAQVRAGHGDAGIEAAQRHLALTIRSEGESSSDTVSAHALLARNLADVGDFDASFEAYETLMAQNDALGDAGESAKAFLAASYGRDLFNGGRYEDAQTQLLAAYEHDPEDYTALSVATGYFNLGDLDGAQEFLAAVAENRTARPGEDFPGQLIAMLRGEKTPDELRQLAQAQGGFLEDRWLCEMYYYLGVKTLAEGHERAGIKYLNACVETNVYRFIEWEAARWLLERMGE